MTAQFYSVKQAFNLPVGSEIVLRGWVRSRRDSKGVTFIELNDGSRFKSMQLVVEAGAISEGTLKQATTGSSIEARGLLVESPAKGQTVELKVTAIQVYGSADPATYPLQKRVIRWNSCARSRTCACAVTPSARLSVCAMH